jgi:hypothetical protein
MIGQHVVATLWSVQYSYEAPRTENTQRFVTGETLILTADPTGDDLRQVVERFVMGAKPAPGYSKFILASVRRLNDVTGLGQTVAPDRGWPTGLEVGAVVLEAGTRHMAAMGDICKRLALANAEITALKAQLEAAKLVPVPAQEASP